MSASKSACPDAELLAACAGGQLPADERQTILRHLTACGACHEVFVEALRFDDEQQRVLAPEVLASAPQREAAPPVGTLSGWAVRGRWRLATVVPIAAAVAWTVGLFVARPGTPLSPSLLTARAPRPSPSASPVAGQTAAELVDLSRPLPAGALPELAKPYMGFGRPIRSEAERCLFIGLASAVLEVRARLDPRQAAAERHKLALLELDVDVHTCVENHGATYQAARAVAWARFAALTRSPKLLAHDEVRRGLAGGRNVSGIPPGALDDVARLVDACMQQPTNQNWESLRELSQDLVESWFL